MSAERNKALVRRFLEAHAKGDLDTLEQMLAPDFVDHNLLPGQRPGREGYLRAHTEYPRCRVTAARNTTLLASMTHGGMGPGLILTGSKSAAVFDAYVGQAQIPTLRPGQVVVVDNLLPHKGERGVHQLLERWGCNVLYLLPYSLDLNPVEEAVFKVKGALRQAGARIREALVGAMDRALDALVARDARVFFEHCRNRLSAPSL